MANPQRIKTVVKEVIPFGDDVYKVDFLSEKKFSRFKPGQFLHLTLESFDPATGFWPESRVFSIAGCSDDRKEISIVYSVKGIYTRKMKELLHPGVEVWLKAPYGDFIIPNYIKPGETAVLIAGGTGISPFIPFLKTVSNDVNVKLNYGLRNIDLVIFDYDLNEALKNNRFNLDLYLESKSDNIPLEGNFSVKSGKLAITEILQNGIDISNSKFFISGPPAMIELFKKQLIDSSVPEDRIVIDEWG